MMQKRFSAEKIGDRETRLRRQKQKITLPYCSPKYFQDYFASAPVCGYTDLRKPRGQREKEGEIGTLFYGGIEISTVREERRRMSATRGYLAVDDGKFLVIESHRDLLWLLPILLALVLLLVLAFCGRPPGQEPKDADSWTPVIEENLGGEAGTTTPAGSQIKIAGFSFWQIPAGQTEALPIRLHNPEGNPCYFSFSIILESTGETLYQSDMVPPGETIRTVDLTHGLEAGTYPVDILITTNALDDGRTMNSASLDVTLTVS